MTRDYAAEANAAAWSAFIRQWNERRAAASIAEQDPASPSRRRASRASRPAQRPAHRLAQSAGAGR